jgi:hypothetical protein
MYVYACVSTIWCVLLCLYLNGLNTFWPSDHVLLLSLAYDPHSSVLGCRCTHVLTTPVRYTNRCDIIDYESHYEFKYMVDGCRQHEHVLREMFTAPKSSISPVRASWPREYSLHISIANSVDLIWPTFYFHLHLLQSCIITCVHVGLTYLHGSYNVKIVSCVGLTRKHTTSMCTLGQHCVENSMFIIRIRQNKVWFWKIECGKHTHTSDSLTPYHIQLLWSRDQELDYRSLDRGFEPWPMFLTPGFTYGSCLVGPI